MREIKHLKYLWILTLISAFFGTYLSWSGMPGLYGFRLLLILHSFLFGICYFWRISRGREKKWDCQVKHYFIFLAFWLAWGMLSLLWSASTYYGIKHLLYLASGCMVVFFTIFYFSTLKDLKALFMANIFVLTFEIALGLWELSSGLHVFGSFPQYYFKQNYLPIIGTFGHPNNFATYLSMYLPIIYVWGKHQQNKGLMLLSFGILVSGFYLIISSTSRANMLALVLGVIIAISLILTKHWGRVQSFLKEKLAIAAILLVIITLFYASQYLDLTNKPFAQEVMSVFTNWDQDSSINVRKTLIIKGMSMLKESYGLGVGPGNSQFLMQQYQDETFGFIKMHNWWVEVLVDYGMLIWSLLLCFFVKMLGDLFRVFRKSGEGSLKMWAEGLIISLCMFCPGVLSNGSIMASAHMWVLFALALCIINVFKIQAEGR